MKTKNILMIVMLVTMMPVMALAMGKVPQDQAVKKGQDVYTCPMHPNYTSDHPGSCPYCGMDLVKKS